MIQVGVSSEAVSAEQVAMKFALFAGVSPQTHLGQEYLQQRLPRLDFANGLVWPSFPLPIALGRRTLAHLRAESAVADQPHGLDRRTRSGSLESFVV